VGRRIPLTVTEDLRVKAGILIFSKELQTAHSTPINMFIDTGSTVTILNRFTAETLGISIERLRRSPSPIAGFGTGAVPAYLIENVYLILIGSDGTSYSPVKMESILVNSQKPHIKKKKGVMKSRPPPPDVLGADYFNKSGLKLYVDFRNRTAYVEE